MQLGRPGTGKTTGTAAGHTHGHCEQHCVVRACDSTINTTACILSTYTVNPHVYSGCVFVKEIAQNNACVYKYIN